MYIKGSVKTLNKSKISMFTRKIGEVRVMCKGHKAVVEHRTIRWGFCWENAHFTDSKDLVTTLNYWRLPDPAFHLLENYSRVPMFVSWDGEIMVNVIFVKPGLQRPIQMGVSNKMESVFSISQTAIQRLSS